MVLPSPLEFGLMMALHQDGRPVVNENAFDPGEIFRTMTASPILIRQNAQYSEVSMLTMTLTPSGSERCAPIRRAASPVLGEL